MTEKYLSPLVSCLTCREVKSVKGLFSHFITSHTEEGKERQLKNAKLGYAAKWAENSKALIIDTEQKNLKYNANPNFCICGKVKTYIQRNNKYCSRRCSVSNMSRDLMTISVRNKISAKLKGKPSSRKGIRNKNNKPKFSFCKICDKSFLHSGRKTCSDDCLKVQYSINGRIAAAKRVKRSKDEIKLYEMCKSYFGNVSHNEPIFNGWDADIILNDYKIAILWNGPWHYKEMGFSNHSLKQVQNRDVIKTKEILNAGWKLYIFEDREYSPESAFEWLKMSELNCSYSL